jgi:hypothetical protein
VVEKAYNPLITAAQDASLTARGGLVERTKAFFVGAPKAGGSGTWIMLARDTPLRREFLMVPLELSPVGGVQ